MSHVNFVAPTTAMVNSATAAKIIAQDRSRHRTTFLIDSDLYGGSSDRGYSLRDIKELAFADGFQAQLTPDELFNVLTLRCARLSENCYRIASPANVSMDEVGPLFSAIRFILESMVTFDVDIVISGTLSEYSEESVLCGKYSDEVTLVTSTDGWIGAQAAAHHLTQRETPLIAQVNIISL